MGFRKGVGQTKIVACPVWHKFTINRRTQLQRLTMEMKTLRIRHFVPASVERARQNRERKGEMY